MMAQGLFTLRQHGEDDYRVRKAAGIPVICALDKSGQFTTACEDLAGIHFKEANKSIIKTLKSSGHLYHQDVIEHNYPFCPRSDTPLIYKAIPSWYVAVTKIKEDILAANETIHWVLSILSMAALANGLKMRKTGYFS